MNKNNIQITPEIKTQNPIVVAMSGGVDSSVAAALMKKRAGNVMGVTLKLYDEKKVKNSKTCCAGVDILDAKKIANTISIPHYVLDFQEIFKESVIDPFINDYKEGRTPIPCINCNEKVKFYDLLEFTKKLNGSALVTGHYIRKIKVDDEWALYVPEDKDRDQSYFLFSIKKEDLDFVEFPLGDFNKNQIRNFAKKMNLHVFDKPDSQDICFIPDGDYKSFIKKNSQDKEIGEVVDINDNVIGQHDGIYNFTIGQRRGIGVSQSKPVYVKEINKGKNRVVVASKDLVKSKSIRLEDTNYLTERMPTMVKVRIRSTGRLIDAEFSKLPDKKCFIDFFSPEPAVSPGQACVFYSEDVNGLRLLGGGWIEATD
jgi:tRNA-specific 2-thiouridylase